MRKNIVVFESNKIIVLIPVNGQAIILINIKLNENLTFIMHSLCVVQGSSIAVSFISDFPLSIDTTYQHNIAK